MLEIFEIIRKESNDKSKKNKNENHSIKFVNKIKHIIINNNIKPEIGINILDFLIEKYIFSKEDQGSSLGNNSSFDDAYILINAFVNSNHIEYNKILIQVILLRNYFRRCKILNFQKKFMMI